MANNPAKSMPRIARQALTALALASLVVACSQRVDPTDELVLAAKNGNTKVVERLLDKGLDVNTRDKQFNATLLMWAAHEGKVDTLKLLLTRGAEMESEKEGGKTALWYAAEQGRTDAARILIQRGAKPDVKSGDGVTALMVAKSRGHSGIAQLLQGAGAQH